MRIPRLAPRANHGHVDVDPPFIRVRNSARSGRASRIKTPVGELSRGRPDIYNRSMTYVFLFILAALLALNAIASTAISRDGNSMIAQKIAQ
jgi:hypothetical protein